MNRTTWGDPTTFKACADALRHANETVPATDAEVDSMSTEALLAHSREWWQAVMDRRPKGFTADEWKHTMEVYIVNR